MKITCIGYWGAYPDKNGATACYLVETEKYNFLIDCGSGALSLVQNYIDLDNIDGVFLSHYHTDHMVDIYVFQYAAMISIMLSKRKKPLEVYGLKEKEFDSLNYKEYCIAYDISPNNKLQKGNITFEFGENTHPVPCVSFRISEGDKVISYISDTEWNENLVKIARDVDLLICESSLYKDQLGVVKGHLTSSEAGKLAKEAGVKKLVLTHLPHYGEHIMLVNEANENYNGKIQIASLGMSWLI